MLGLSNFGPFVLFVFFQVSLFLIFVCFFVFFYIALRVLLHLPSEGVNWGGFSGVQLGSATLRSLEAHKQDHRNDRLV